MVVLSAHRPPQPSHELCGFQWRWLRRAGLTCGGDQKDQIFQFLPSQTRPRLLGSRSSLFSTPSVTNGIAIEVLIRSLGPQ